MTQTQSSYLTRFQSQGKGTKAGQKPISVLLPVEIDAIVRAMDNRSEFVRQAVIEKLQREDLLSSSDER